MNFLVGNDREHTVDHRALTRLLMDYVTSSLTFATSWFSPPKTCRPNGCRLIPKRRPDVDKKLWSGIARRKTTKAWIVTEN